MPVNTPRSEYTDALPGWERLRDTNGGRDTMLAAGSKYVPDLPGASHLSNAAYRKRGNFYNAVQRTVFGMTGMLFSKDMQTKFPERYKNFVSDVTLDQVSLEMFAFTTAQETLLIGRYGVLVEMNDEVGPDQRPYLCGYPAENIINWKVEDGDVTLVVLKERYETPNPSDEFVSVCGIQYRALSLINGIYIQQIYRKAESGPHKDQYVQFGPPIMPLRRSLPLDFIPFIFFGPLHVTSDIVKPPLLDLADVNIGHWRNSVDYEQGIHLVALPTPWVAGMKTPPAGDDAIKVGPNVVWELDVNGKAGMLEFQGTGMEAIVVAMDEKKKQMASLGARLMESEPRVQETATALQMRHSGDHASLRSLSVAIGQGLTLALQTMLWWVDATVAKLEETPASVELNKDFFTVRIAALDVQAALASVQAGAMSFETFWHFLLTGGWGRDGVTAEEEQAQIAKEEPILPPVNPNDVMPPEPGPTSEPAPAKPKPPAVH